ncbi:35066_t:CDS:1, partial [Racocetra persica]
KRKQKKQILANDKSDNYYEDNTDELFNELEYENKELEEFESFSSNCVSSDEENTMKMNKDERM